MQLQENPSWAAIPDHLLWSCLRSSSSWKRLSYHYRTSSDSWWPQGNNAGYSSNERYNFMATNLPDDYLDCQGRYHIRMEWREIGRFNEWYQTSNPNEDSTVTGFQRMS